MEDEDVANVSYVGNEYRKPYQPRKEWKPYEEFIKEKEARYRPNGQGYYKANEAPPIPPTVEKPSGIEEVLARFADSFEKRQKEHEAMLKSQNAFILNIEKQMGQISKALQERPMGAMPSFTEDNPNNQRPP